VFFARSGAGREGQQRVDSSRLAGRTAGRQVSIFGHYDGALSVGNKEVARAAYGGPLAGFVRAQRLGQMTAAEALSEAPWAVEVKSGPRLRSCWFVDNLRDR